MELCLHDGDTCSSVAPFACITEWARVGRIGAATCLGEEDAPGETTAAHVHTIFPVALMYVLFVMLNYSIIWHLLSSMFYHYVYMHCIVLCFLNSPEWLGNSDMIEVRTH